MKTRSLVATVAGLHVVVIGGALLISGCRSLPPSMDNKDKKPAKGPSAPTSDVASNPDPLLPPPPPALPPPLPPIPEKPAITESTYKVQKGDTLSKIAKHQGVSLTAMLDANKMTTKSVIHPGQVIVIPNGASAHGTTAAVKTSAASSETYVVKKGDSLAKIAKTNGTSVTALKEANHLNSDGIQVGQKLQLPAGSETSPSKHHAAKRVEPMVTKTITNTAATPAPADSGKYTVAKGDSPATIAKKLGVKTDELMAANHLTPETAKGLQIGQTLVVPGKGAPVAPTSTALPPAPVPPTDGTPATTGTTAPPPSPVTTETAPAIAAPVAPPTPPQP